MLDLISIGTVTIDIYYKGESLTHDTDRFELAVGGKYFADSFYEGLGGGGANVAIGTIKNGLTAGLIAKIGNNPFKDMICNKLESAGVQYQDFCQFENEYINISSVLLTEKGEKTIINYRTPHQQVMTCEDDYNMLSKAKNLYLANLSKVSLEERVSILKYAKDNGLKTFANLNVTDCRRPIEQILPFLNKVDVFMINTHEFADIVKTSYQSIDFHSKITEKYAPFNADQLLVVTDGAKGSYAYYQNKVYHEPAQKVETIADTTGAGDGYTSAFIASYIKTEGDIQASMKKGSEYAAGLLGELGAN